MSEAVVARQNGPLVRAANAVWIAAYDSKDEHLERATADLTRLEGVWPETGPGLAEVRSCLTSEAKGQDARGKHDLPADPVPAQEVVQGAHARGRLGC